MYRILTFLSFAAIAGHFSYSQDVASDRVDCSTLTGKVMCGYQGWFNCDGDSMGIGWVHWSRNHREPFGPGNVTVDLWPDMTEMDSDERYATGFHFADGQTAEVFSSANRKTVVRHFKWMQDYGIDGAFVQRFSSGLADERHRRHKDSVLGNARRGAERYGRAFAVMYDLSGMREGQLGRVIRDWSQLQSERQIGDSESYLHHDGKPVVAVWGIGFKERHQSGSYTLKECEGLVSALKESGCCVMLGVPTGWRELDRDCVNDPLVHKILKMADVVSPWTPGRYRNPPEVDRHAEQHWQPDLQWCKNVELEYLPVVFPGFSWHNLRNGEAELGQIPRLKGQFLWSQIVAAKRSGASMIYVAMFDEVDEGTAIFKCTNSPPVGTGVKFLTCEGLPSDYYLKLVGHGGKMLRDEVKTTIQIPSSLSP